MLRIIPISNPRQPGSSSHGVANSDTTETILRKNVVANGLIAGETIPVIPTNSIWHIIDHIKTK
jgi:hypothetical protein